MIETTPVSSVLVDTDMTRSTMLFATFVLDRHIVYA